MGAFASAVAIRLLIAAHRPALWIDETFTGVYASQPTVGDVLKLSYQDVNAPGYHLLAHFWASLFSVSNDSLRAPSLLAGVVAPLFCFLRAPGLPWRAQALWFVNVALWPLASTYSSEARCYSIVFLFSVLNAVAFIRLVGNRRPMTALFWGLTGAAMVLLHYFAVVLLAMQALVLVCILRRRIYQLWPAAPAFAPAAAWCAFHLPHHMEVARTKPGWLELLPGEQLLDHFVYASGATMTVVALVAGARLLFPSMTRAAAPASMGHDRSRVMATGVAVVMISYLILSLADDLGLSLLIVAIVAALYLFFSPATASQIEAQIGCGPWLAAATGAGSVLACLTLGVFWPTYQSRYLMIFAPACLLLTPLVLEKCAVRLAALPALAVLLLIGMGWTRSQLWEPPLWHSIEWETASANLATAGAREVVFFWDSPAAPDNMPGLGSFFFDRAGSNVATLSVALPSDADPNIELARLADAPQAGFIWVYDSERPHVAAKRHPPRLEELSQKFACRTSGRSVDGETIAGALFCLRKG